MFYDLGVVAGLGDRGGYLVPSVLCSPIALPSANQNLFWFCSQVRSNTKNIALLKNKQNGYKCQKYGFQNTNSFFLLFCDNLNACLHLEPI